MHESDCVTYLEQENDKQKNNLKYFFRILFHNMQILNRITAHARHSLVFEVEMDNFLGVESVAPSATPKPVE